MNNRTVHIDFDLNTLQQVSILGVRRAAAFIAIAFNATENWNDASLALPSHSMWQFFPDPAPSELISNIVSEFRCWVVGNALRELDAAFNEFIDRAWVGFEWLKLHGTTVKSNFKIDSIEKKTNAAAKLEMLIAALDKKPENVEKLRSLSNARNCLTHARGVVTPRHANIGNSLQIEWLGLEMAFEQGGAHTVIPVPIPKDGVSAPNPNEPAAIVAKIVDRKKTFDVGTVLSIEPAELHEICRFYLILTDQVVDALKVELAKRGVLSRESTSTGIV